MNETLILPGDVPTLFELYSVFKLLCRIKENFDLKKIDEGSKEIAVFKKEDERMLVYHDSTGGMHFHEKVRELRNTESNNEQLERYRRSVVKHAEIIEKLLEETEKSFYSGRPDILIEHYKKDDLKRLIIGEVKYSENKTVFSKGLKELIRYVYFSRKGSEYSLENLDIKGILVLDKKEFLDEEKLDKLNLIKNIDFDCDLEILDTEKLKEHEYENNKI